MTMSTLLHRLKRTDCTDFLQPEAQQLSQTKVTLKDDDYVWRCSKTKVHLATVVQDEHEGTANTTNNVCNETFVQALRQALFRCDLRETMLGALVDVLFYWLFRLHLQTTAHRVEGISGSCSNGNCRLCGSEGRYSTHQALVFFPRVDTSDRVETAELQPAVPYDAYHRDAEAGIQSHEPTRACCCLLHAIQQAAECLLT